MQRAPIVMLVTITMRVLLFSQTQGGTGAEALGAAPVPEGSPPVADDVGAPPVPDAPVVDEGAAPLVAGAVGGAQTVAAQLKVRSLNNHSNSPL